MVIYLKGYTGKILQVDLESKKISIIPINKEWSKLFLGGSGYAARLLYDKLTKDLDPLSPENPLLFMTGPLTATPAPTAGRYIVCAKSPLTNIWGESTSGGTFGSEIKFAGYDGILLLNKAENLSYISINDDIVEIKDAKKLKNKDAYTVQEKIREMEDSPKMKVAAIGAAGENMVRFAAIMNDEGRAAGRTGMGAVMGSKNLKAIGIRGRGFIEVEKPKRYLGTIRAMNMHQKENFAARMFRELGTAGYLDTAYAFGDLIAKYYTQGDWEASSNLSGSTQKEKYIVKNTACFACAIACGHLVENKEGTYKIPKTTEACEYETLGALGSLCLNENLESVLKANYLCNFHGLDTISCGATIAFTMYCYDKGYITIDDTEGLEMKWGDSELILKLIDMIATRKGFGNVIAEGTARMGQKFNVNQDEIGVVKGLDAPMHDPRAFFGMAIQYATSNRGACHMAGDDYEVCLGNDAKEFGVTFHDRFSDDNLGEHVSRLQDLRSLWSSMILCNFTHPKAQYVADLMTLATGNKYEIEDLRKAGERIFNLKRVINNKLGVTEADDMLPKILLTPVEGATEGKVPDFVRQKNEYYDFRKWDKSGKPSKEKLKELNLEFTIKDIWGSE
ncbi:MAG: aldehyde ferredoxin oxidoreductase [Candidatus Lokiarchaeota archaeon]|nr:aldehyde ferredoxin oxidoreductase [Candidatus Lokiarchaeota archaeon]